MSKRLRHKLVPACIALACLLPAPARAGGAEDEARRLFDEGSSAERAGKPVEACAKFRQSLSVVRELGPLSKVKDCDLREGKLVAGAANLSELISRWPQPGPELEALKAELVAIEKRTPRLTVSLRNGAPPGVSARLDGSAIDLPASNRAVDPGKHEVLVEVPGRPLERLTIELTDAERKTVEVPAAPAIAAETGKRNPPTAASEGLGALGIVGIVVAAVGVGGFVGAGVTGKLVLDKQSEFEAGHCGAEDPLLDAPDCGAIASDGDSLLIANGVLWGVGIAGVAVGATLLVVDLVSGSSKPGAATATLGVRPGRAELTIRF